MASCTSRFRHCGKISFKNAKVRIKYISNFQHEIFGKKAKLARSGL